MWVKVRERNEAFDIRNYNYVALKILDPVWDVIARARAAELANDGEEEEATPVIKRRRQPNFVNRFGRGRG